MPGTHNEAVEHHDKFETLEMGETNVQINFDARATLRKWPSLDDCVREFMAKPAVSATYMKYTLPRRGNQLAASCPLNKSLNWPAAGFSVSGCLFGQVPERTFHKSYIPVGTFILNQLCP